MRNIISDPGAVEHEIDWIKWTFAEKNEIKKLRDENAILGKAIEELLKNKNQEPSSGMMLQNLLKENRSLKWRVQSWKARALEEANVVSSFSWVVYYFCLSLT